MNLPQRPSPSEDASSPPFFLSAQARAISNYLALEPNVTRYMYLFFVEEASLGTWLSGCLDLTFEARMHLLEIPVLSWLCKLWKEQARCDAWSYSPLAVDPQSVLTFCV